MVVWGKGWQRIFEESIGVGVRVLTWYPAIIVSPVITLPRTDGISL